MSNEPKVTRFGADPTVDQELATKSYVDTSAGGATATAQRDQLSADNTTTSLTYVDSNLEVTLPTRTDGKFLACAGLNIHNTGTNELSGCRWEKGGVATQGFGYQWTGSSAFRKALQGFLTGDLDGDVLNLQFATFSGTFTLMGVVSNAMDYFSHIEVLEIS